MTPLDPETERLLQDMLRRNRRIMLLAAIGMFLNAAGMIVAIVLSLR